jgi:hypothetical protein
MATITLRTVKGSPLTNTEVDDNFSNLNTDKYESGDSVVVADITSSGDHTASISAAVSAAGTDQTGATALSKTFNVVSTATENQGVKLPAASAGVLYTIINGTSANVKIYPNTSGTINSGAANASILIAPGSTIKLIGIDNSNWNTMVETIIYDSSGSRLN